MKSEVLKVLSNGQWVLEKGYKYQNLREMLENPQDPDAHKKLTNHYHNNEEYGFKPHAQAHPRSDLGRQQEHMRQHGYHPLHSFDSGENELHVYKKRDGKGYATFNMNRDGSVHEDSGDKKFEEHNDVDSLEDLYNKQSVKEDMHNVRYWNLPEDHKDLKGDKSGGYWRKFYQNNPSTDKSPQRYTD